MTASEIFLTAWLILTVGLTVWASVGFARADAAVKRSALHRA